MGHGSPLVLHHGSAISGREQSLIVGYEMDAQEGMLINKEVTGLGGGSDGTLTGTSLPRQMQDRIHGRGIRFLGNSAVTFTNTGSTAVGTILMTARPLALAGVQYLFYDVVGATQYRIYFNGAVLTTRFGTAAGTASTYSGINGNPARIAVRWEADGTVTVFADGQPVGSYAGTAFANDIGTAILGASTAAGANGFVGDEHELDFVRRAMTDEEILRDYMLYALRAHYQESFRSAHVSSAGTAAGRLENTHWTVVNAGATDFRIDHDLLSERIFGIKNSKYIRCVADGLVWIPTQSLGMRAADPEAARGTYDFWLKHAEGSTTHVLFIASDAAAWNAGTQNGYEYRVSADESVLVRRITGGIGATQLGTAPGAFPVDTWQRISIAVRQDGRFTVRRNGQLEVATAGTNPFTDTTHQNGSCVLGDVDAGDCMGPITHRWGECL